MWLHGAGPRNVLVWEIVLAIRGGGNQTPDLVEAKKIGDAQCVRGGDGALQLVSDRFRAHRRTVIVIEQNRIGIRSIGVGRSQSRLLRGIRGAEGGIGETAPV